jgi:hypothetical protein
MVQNVEEVVAPLGAIEPPVKTEDKRETIKQKIIGTFISAVKFLL